MKNIRKIKMKLKCPARCVKESSCKRCKEKVCINELAKEMIDATEFNDVIEIIIHQAKAKEGL